MQSNELGELFAALSAAQGEFGDVLKDKTADAGKYKYSYADLADVIKATKTALTKHGLAVTQLTRGGSGTITVTTILGHKSGQFIGDEWEIPASGLDMQRLGGLITYARRYSHTAILGIAADTDDDAQEATATQRKAHSNVVHSGNGKPASDKTTPTTDLKPVSSRNRALVSNLVELRDTIKDEAKGAAQMDDKQKAAFVERVRKLERDTNVQLVLRGMAVMPKAEKVGIAFEATHKAISQLVEHDQNAPVTEDDAQATAEALAA